MAQAFMLVRNNSNTITKLSKDDVMKIFLGEVKQWQSSALIQVVLGKKGSPQMQWLAKEIFGISELALLSKIANEVFNGEMRKPIITQSDSDTIISVKAHKGGIGIVSFVTAKQLPDGVETIVVFE